VVTMAVAVLLHRGWVVDNVTRGGVDNYEAFLINDVSRGSKLYLFCAS
jgi:hypothetical protein